MPAAWLGLAPELFFQPPRIRTESTPEVIAHHLIRDPNLSDAAAEQIAGLVRQLYTNLARPPHPAAQIRLRAAPTFKQEAARLLGDLLDTMQVSLTGHADPGQTSR